MLCYRKQQQICCSDTAELLISLMEKLSFFSPVVTLSHLRFPMRPQSPGHHGYRRVLSLSDMEDGRIDREKETEKETERTYLESPSSSQTFWIEVICSTPCSPRSDHPWYLLDCLYP